MTDVIAASLSLLTVIVLCSWLRDIDTRLHRMENLRRSPAGAADPDGTHTVDCKGCKP